MYIQPRRAAGRTLAGLTTLILASAGLAGCSQPGPQDALDDFLSGWRSGDLSKVAFVGADGSSLAATEAQKRLNDVSGDLQGRPMRLTSGGEPKTTGSTASAPIKLDWTLPGGVTWSYSSTVRLRRQGDEWRVLWEPAVLHSGLTDGDKLKIRRSPAPRADILDRSAKPLVTPRDVVVVGVTPQRITDIAALQKGLTNAFRKVGVSLDLSDLPGRVKSAEPDAFIDLLTLRSADYKKISSRVRKLAGAVPRPQKRNLAPTREFARALLGTSDPATLEDIQADPQTVAQGDVVGHGGLQERYDSVLRGVPGQSVVITRTGPGAKAPGTALFSSEPAAGKPIKVTLDPAVQTAADQALAIEKHPSSLIAIRVSDGSVLAVANGPDGGTVDTALTGKVPPGSTFKAVSAYGLLQKKVVTANSTVPCPKTATVAGRKFKNAGGEVLGKVPFHVDFAQSCNTAFVGLSGKLGADDLGSAAAALGLGGQWDLGVKAFSGKVSEAGSPTELAAATFGQGATAVSPVAMASVVAAIARGQFKQPKLLLDPAPANPAADGPALDKAAMGTLRTMMREVVTSGTGKALRTVPGKPVYGKTGTAEFDDRTEDTHSWFIGYQGDVAFAVMVERGGAGAEAAVPIVGKFLTALNR